MSFLLCLLLSGQPDADPGRRFRGPSGVLPAQRKFSDCRGGGERDVEPGSRRESHRRRQRAARPSNVGRKRPRRWKLARLRCRPRAESFRWSARLRPADHQRGTRCDRGTSRYRLSILTSRDFGRGLHQGRLWALHVSRQRNASAILPLGVPEYGVSGGANRHRSAARRQSGEYRSDQGNRHRRSAVVGSGLPSRQLTVCGQNAVLRAPAL